jgi:hypothetical protein
VPKTLDDHGPPQAPAGRAPGDDRLLAAVREDVRQTLRTPWIEPAFDKAAEVPLFLTAAWSAIRPNVGKSFLTLARAIRCEAADSARIQSPPDLRKRLESELSENELRRVEHAALAAHLAAAKAQIVVHILYRAARRERLAGTGREESPVRRGVPEADRWMGTQPEPHASCSVLDESAAALALSAAPTPLRLLARWPEAARRVWDEVRAPIEAELWKPAAARLRRMVLAGVTGLPHPVELQWSALRSRGFGEEERVAMVAAMAGYDAAMPIATLLAAFGWVAFGAPDLGAEA